MITLSELKNLYDFDPGTGVFSRRISTTRAKAGSFGSVNDQGYVVLFLNGCSVRGHRTAWFYFYGEWPKSNLDHINGNRSDNRICNLREASHQQNMKNRKIRLDNSCGYKGVGPNKHCKTWRARITVNGRPINIGHFKSKEEARDAYIEAAKKYHGEFASF